MLEGKVAVVFQDAAHAETVDLLAGPLAVKPDRPFVLRYCSSIKSFCASDCFGCSKDKSCLVHIKQRIKFTRGNLNGLGYEWPDAKRRQVAPAELTGAGGRVQSPTDATVYVQAYKDESARLMGVSQMPANWIATARPDPRLPPGIGYAGSGSQSYRVKTNPSGEPTHVRQVPPAAGAAPAPSPQTNNTRLQGARTVTPPHWRPMPPRPQLQLLPQPHQMLLQPTQPSLSLLPIPLQMSFLPPQLSLMPMPHPMPFLHAPPPMPCLPIPPTMPIFPMKHTYPGLAVW